MLGRVPPVSAQVTYSVFPAQPHALAGQASQPTGHGVGAPVTIDVQDSTIEYVVKEIARQAHLQAVYNSGPLFRRLVTVRLEKVQATDAFATVLKGTGLVSNMAPDGETVVIRPQSRLSPAALSQFAAGSVVGRVTDSASGAGLGGAAVKVEGTKLSTVTSDSGRFTLKDVPTGDQVLSVRLFGYRPAERTVTVVDSERTTVHIVM
ncbi:MAG TPA: carboxypeptidase regulatory-like domain-containing protein, partial [Gemmatimonadaceae bacterium]|nr:carboxypeptidase regulatory-like domain-containing protein [Gemmatimonadaceae bacterium]